MRVFGRTAGLATMSGVLLTAVAGAAHAAPSDAGGFALIHFSNSGDSLIEVDRTLNFNSGDGSAGSDNDND